MSQPIPPLFETDSPYRRLARRLDDLPNRFPPADDESDLRLLAKLFTPEEAALAAELLPDPETPAQIAQRLGRDMKDTFGMLKEMSRKGLIVFGKTTQGRPGFGLMPFVVGIYEEQAGRMDVELAQLFEAYYQKAFNTALKVQPQFHRVVPVGVSVKNNMEVHPFESVSDLVDRAQSWGVINCVCRTQKALIGKGCEHPVDVCMILSDKPDAFGVPESAITTVAGSGPVHSLTKEGAFQTLRRAAEAGLVHCVSNNQRDLWYICNCCTCSCSILRGMSELGIANVVARSAFVNQVDESLCIGCGECLSACQFNALSVDGTAQVEVMRCVGCGLCVLACPQNALGLERRPDEAEPPLTEADWRDRRGETPLGA